MENNSRAEIAELLNANLSETAIAARLAAVALRWWLSATEQHGDDRVELLASLSEISDGLAQIQDTLQNSLPKLQEGARPRAILQQKLSSGLSALIQNQAEIQRLHTELEPLLVEEKKMHSQVAEIAGLKKNLEELHHLQNLAEHAVALRGQLDEITRHLPPEGLEVGQIEKAILQAGSDLIILQQAALTNLREGVRKTLEKAVKSEAEIRQAALDLQSARERYQKADDALTPEIRQTLKLYNEADQAVARALPGARTLEELIRDIERKLSEADAVLKAALEANEKAKTIAILPHVHRPA